MKRTHLAIALLGVLANVASAQVAPGHRVYGTLQSTDVHLLDAAGTIVHTWPTSFRPGLGTYLLPDGTLMRGVSTTGSGVPGLGGGVQRYALDGTVLWDFRYDGPEAINHHDIEVLPNGNVLLIAYEEISDTEAIAAGRDPALFVGNVFRPERVVEVRPTGPTSGDVVWQWRAMDHVIQDVNSRVANYGNVAAHPELIDINFPPLAEGSDDWLHMNGIDYDPLTDRIILSAREQSEIWVIDHSTTTAEAAGHTGGRWGKGGDLLYRWGNPQAYRRGGIQDQQLFLQHDPQFIPPGHPGAGNVTVFSNRHAQDASAVHEIVLPLDSAGRFVLRGRSPYGPAQPSWTYEAPGFYSPVVSGAERLPNGNTLICSGVERRLFEVTPSGQIVWEHIDSSGTGYIFHAQYVEHSLWASREPVSASAGGRFEFDLIAGSPHASDFHLLLGSVSGTSPGLALSPFLTFPLNFDAFTEVTVVLANEPPFSNTFGTLDPRGRAMASLDVPAGSVPLGSPLSMDFAFFVADPVSGVPLAVSNPARVVIEP